MSKLQHRLRMLLREGINATEIRRRTIIVLVFIGLLTFVDHMVVYTQVELSEQSHVVAQATFQQRRDIRWARRLMMDMLNLSGDELAEARDNLRLTANKILSIHQDLHDGIYGNFAKDETRSQELDRFYNLPPYLFDTHLKDYVAHLLAIADEASPQLTPSNPHYQHVVSLEHTGELFDAIDAIVNYHQDTTTEQIEQLKLINLVNFLVTMLVLILAGIFVFRPMILAIENTLAKLNDANRQLFDELNARERAEQSLLETAKQKERTLTALTHDLRTPIRGECRILEQWLQGIFGPIDAVQRDIVETMLHSGRTMDHMLDNMLATLHYEDKNIRLVSEPTKVNTLLRQVFGKDLQIFAADKHQTIELNLTADLPKVLGDSIELRRVFMNIGQNAIKYSPSHSTIRVESVLTEEHVLVHIDDEGAGIPEEIAATLFEPFNTLTHKYRQIGMGMGLYLSKIIVETHGGELSYTPLEKGTRFTIQLPVVNTSFHADAMALEEHHP